MKAQAFNSTIQSEKDIFVKCSNFLVKFDHNAVADINLDGSYYEGDHDYVGKVCSLDPKKDIKPVLREILDGVLKNVKQMEDEITVEKFLYQQVSGMTSVSSVY